MIQYSLCDITISCENNVFMWLHVQSLVITVTLSLIDEQITFCLISNVRHVLNVVRFLFGDSPASEFYIPTFRNTLFHLHRRVGMKDDYV